MSDLSELSGRERVSGDAQARGVHIDFARRGQASSLEEAAATLGIQPREIVKTLIAKAKATQSTSEHSYVMALIPGDRQVDWAKLRKLAGMKKMSMAAPEEGFGATGFYPGTINPFGTTQQLPIYGDSSIRGRIAMGAGEPDLNLFVDAAELFAALGVVIGDISK